MAKKSDLERLQSILKLMAPGEILREGVDYILKAESGALIVLGDPEVTLKCADGGFHLDIEMTPTTLYELSKMDGAILLTSDAKKIYHANAHLVPDPSLPSSETGTRHRSAERMARQTGCPVICISEARKLVTVYVGEAKYVLQDLPVLMAKASQALQTLEKYRGVYDKAMADLDTMEMEDLVSINEIVTCLQRAEMVLRVGDEVQNYVLELGAESRLVKMQMQQLVTGVEEEAILILKDYVQGRKDVEKLWKDIRKAPLKDIINPLYLADLLGLGSTQDILEQNIIPRGYRILRKLPRLTQPLPLSIIEKIIQTFGNLRGVMQATPAELDDVEGIGDVRAQAISDGLRKAREQIFLPR